MEELLKQLFNRCHQQAGNNRKSQRLLHPMEDPHASEQKSFPAHAGDLNVVGWKMTGGKSLRAFMLTQNQRYGYFYDISKLNETQTHTHDYLELGYVVDGYVTQVIEGKTVRFTKGDFCLIDTGSSHYDMLEGDATALFFGISDRLFNIVFQSPFSDSVLGDFMRRSLISQKERNQYIHFREDPHREVDHSQLNRTMESLLLELLYPDSGTAYILFGLTLRLFEIILENYTFTLTQDQSNRRNQMISDEIVEYIEEHYRDIHISDLVNKFHYNKDYFNRLIAKREGKTYSEFVQDIRLKQAKKMLLETDMAVDDIINDVGYKNKGYFYKIFQEKYGVTPAKYRKDASV